jgi:hypothetical protein
VNRSFDGVLAQKITSWGMLAFGLGWLGKIQENER